MGPSISSLLAREVFFKNPGNWDLGPIKRANSVDLGRFDSAIRELGNPFSKSGPKSSECNPFEGGPTNTKHLNMNYILSEDVASVSVVCGSFEPVSLLLST